MVAQIVFHMSRNPVPAFVPVGRTVGDGTEAGRIIAKSFHVQGQLWERIAELSDNWTIEDLRIMRAIGARVTFVDLG